MGANAGPDIVSDGLVLALDAADNNSFRGEPTENLVPSGQRTCSSNFTRRGYHVEQWFYALETNVFGRVDATKISITPTGNNSQPYADWGFTAHKSGGSQVGDVYTVSFDYKVIKNTTVPSLAVVYANGYKSPTSAGAASLSNETHTLLEDGWTRFSETATITTAGNTWWRFGMSSNNNETEVYVDNFQIELNSSRTRFVDGTRGTTVATGGGWKDISGNDNHGEILNGTSTSNDGSVLGALDFDGTNDYVDTGLTFDKQDFTYSAWVNFSSTSGTFQDIIDSFESTSSEWARLCLINGNFGFICDNNSNRKDAIGSSASTGVWYHMVGTRIGSAMTLYVNGSVNATQTQSQLSVIQGLNSERIGAQTVSGAELFNGKIALVQIYDKGLTASEVLQNYNSLKTRFRL